MLAKLPFDSLCHCKLGVIEGITGFFVDIIVDLQYFFRKRLRPCFHALSEGKHFHLPQIAAGNERIQHIVLKLRDQRCGGFPVYLSKQTRTVSGRAKDIAFAWVFRGVLIAVVGSILLRLTVVVGHQGRNGIYPVMGQHPSVAFGPAIQI